MSSIEQIDSKSLENLYDNVKKKLDDIANNIQTVKAEQVGAKSDDKASIEQKDRANALADAKKIFQKCE